MITHHVLVNRKSHRVKVLERKKNTFLVAVNEKTVKAKIRKKSRGKTITVEINNRFFRAKMKRIRGNTLHVKIGERIFEVQRQPKTPKMVAPTLDHTTAITRRPALKLTAKKDVVTAPIAGRIELLKAVVGQKVRKGECVCVLEAMKMENEIVAPKAGVIKEIRVSKGAVVNKGDVLAVIT